MHRRASRILTVCAGAWLRVIWGQSCLPAAHSGAESGALLTPHPTWPAALLPGTLAARCDETIQPFVPGRSGQITDGWLDTAGYLTGALLTLLIFFLCRKRPKQRKTP